MKSVTGVPAETMGWTMASLSMAHSMTQGLPEATARRKAASNSCWVAARSPWMP